MHNCGSIMHRFQFWWTDVGFVHYVDAHIFSVIKTIKSELENEVQKAKLHLRNQINIYDADWFLLP